MNIQWIRRGYSSRIADPAPLAELGGSTKIDSIQNVILLRGDLHAAWHNYKVAVNPDVCICHLSKSTSSHHECTQLKYAVIPFVPGYNDIAGNILKLDHIADPNLRPLDELLRDHFFQCVLKN